MKIPLTLLAIIFTVTAAHAANHSLVDAQDDRTFPLNQPNPKVGQTSSQTRTQRNKTFHNVVLISDLYHMISEQNSPHDFCHSCYEYTDRGFEGYKIGYQYNVSRHIATQISLKRASLDSIEITDGGQAVIRKYPAKENYTGLSVDLLFNLNNYRGFHLFSGLGYSYDRYSTKEEKRSYSSILLNLGVGVALNKVQTTILYQPYLLSEFPSNYRAYNFLIQLGVHF